jgi:hypothetical protein
MSSELVGVVFAGIAGIVAALGLPKYFDWKREKQDSKIKELLAEIDLSKAKINELKQEIILEREKRRTTDSLYHRLIDRFNTNLVYLEIMSENDQDLKKIVKGLKESMNISPIIN